MILQAPEVAVGGLMLRNGKVLLVKRKNPPGKGLWAIPGGRVRFCERLHQAVEREVLEETGLKVSPIRLIYVAEIVENGFHYIILDYLCDILGGKVRAGGDVEDVKWFDINTLGDDVTNSTRKLVDMVRNGMPLHVRNCDIEWVVIGIPKGHMHYRTLLKLKDGLLLVFQEATITGILRGFANVVLHPFREYLKLVCKKGDWKKGYAEYQLVEGDPEEAKKIIDALYGKGEL